MDAKTEAQLTTDRMGVDGFELPCGYIDANGVLHTYVEVTEITGTEEEILGAKNMPVIKKMNKVLANCTKVIGDITDPSKIEKIIPELTQGDRVFILFAIRRVSLGDDFPFTTECPNCKKETDLVVDLSELTTQKMLDPKLRVYDLVLPKSKKTVSMKVMTGHGEEAISKATTVGKDIISTAMLARIDAINGRPASIADLKALSLADRNFIRNEWQDHEGGVDTNVDITCPACDHEYATDVDMGAPGFFDPARVQRLWRKKSDS